MKKIRRTINEIADGVTLESKKEKLCTCGGSIPCDIHVAKVLTYVKFKAGALHALKQICPLTHSGDNELFEKATRAAWDGLQK